MTIIANNVVAIQNTVEPVVIYVRNSDGLPIDATNLRLTILDRGSTVLLPIWQTAPRIMHTGTGIYTFNLGEVPFSLETSCQEKILFLWQADGETSTTQIVDVVSVGMMMVLSAFQEQIDKSRKDYDENPDDPIYLGYSTTQLIGYLNGGLGIINAAQPYPTWSSVDQFPVIHQQILIESAILVGIQSQELYAVDVDLNYSNQGNTFDIAHFPKLESYANALAARLEKQIPLMKLQYVSSGQLHIEMGPSFRLAQLLQAAPGGEIFRNMFVAGHAGSGNMGGC